MFKKGEPREQIVRAADDIHCSGMPRPRSMRTALWITIVRQSRLMSALPPKADMDRRDGNVRFVPKPAVSNRSKQLTISIISSPRGRIDVGNEMRDCLGRLEVATCGHCAASTIRG